MRNLMLFPLAVVTFATACADREMTSPVKSPGRSASSSVTPTPERTFAYVANAGSDNVSVIRTSDNTVVATIAVGDDPRALAFTPSAGRVYVANNGSNNVSVIRTTDNTVIATIPVGTHPQDVDVAPDGGRVYVMNAGDGTVSVIQTSDNTVATSIHTGTEAGSMAITPDGAELFVNNGVRSTGGVFDVVNYYTSVIRTSDYTVRGTINWGAFRSTDDVAITPDGSRAYLPNNSLFAPNIALRVVQTSNLSEVTTLTLPGFFSARSVAITPDGAAAYVVKPGFPSLSPGGACSAGGIWIVPTATNTLETTVSVSCYPNKVAFTPDGARAYMTYIAQDGTGNVAVINTSQKAVVGTVAVGTSPNGLGIAFVPTPNQLAAELKDLTSALDLPNGIEISLLAKLNSAVTAMAAGQTSTACGALQDFVSQVKAIAGKKIATADAAQLIEIANQVRELIGC